MFPLPLTAFEEYMFRDDRPGFPMTVVYRMRFRGRLREDLFEQCVGAVVERHPLLRATVELRRGRCPQWVERRGWRPAVQWQATADHHGYPSIPPFDLTLEPGVRVWGIERPEGHDVVLAVHHAATDAMGFSQVMEDLLIDYALRCGGAPAGLRLPALEPARLLRRAEPGFTMGRFIRQLPQLLPALAGVLRFLRHRPTPLARPVGPLAQNHPPAAFPSPSAHEFTPAQTAGILAAARSQQATVNDLLLRDMLLTMVQWRRRRGLAGPREWLRLAVPVNLRAPGDESMPMANAVSMVFLDRRPADAADAERLLRSVQRQMLRVKGGPSQYSYVRSLELLRRLPGGLTRMLQADKCHATCVLSNLGPVFARVALPREDARVAAGNVVLESVDFVPPLRPHVHAALAVGTYAGRMRITLHAHPLALPAEEPAELLGEFAAQIDRSVGQPLDRAA